MGKINQSTAFSKAESAARTWYLRNKTKVDNKTYTAVFNTGNDDDWVSASLQESIRKAWKAKDNWNGLERRASFSSGETKFDLKLAIVGKTASCFNYHVPFKADTGVEIARKAQSNTDKKMAKAFKEEQEEQQEHEAEEQEEANKLVVAEQKRRRLLIPKANEAWNTFKTTRAFKKTIDEAKWKQDWIDEEMKKVPLKKKK